MFLFSTPSAATGDDLDFFRLWLRQPLKVGAVVPSGRALAKAMAACIDAGAPGAVVELGGGTGAVTRAILAAGVVPADLIVVERVAALCRVIAARFPGVRVLYADARDLDALLREAGVAHVKAVVSGLPLLSMEREACRRILAASFAVLGEAGLFVQFTYGPASPISHETRAALGIVGERAHWVVSNLPPATVWRYRRAKPATDTRRAA